MAKQKNPYFIFYLGFSGKRVSWIIFHKLSRRTEKRTISPFLTFLSQDNAVGKPAIVLELVIVLALVMKKVQGDNLSKASKVLNVYKY